MIEFEIREINPGSGYEERHITGIKEFMERNISRELAGKAEAGTNRSERGYQILIKLRKRRS